MTSECVICLEELGTDLYIMPCRHNLHRQCFREYRNHGFQKCCVCQQPIPATCIQLVCKSPCVGIVYTCILLGFILTTIAVVENQLSIQYFIYIQLSMLGVLITLSLSVVFCFVCII